ncbi:MAG: hypothetical protein ACFFB5_21990 [Promethearchaeota archaeon]
MKNGKTDREKICRDFFPNCNICNFFFKCYPNNGLNDEFSEIALQELIMANNNLEELRNKMK